MKTKYLLSTLAISAAFVACTNEDFTVDEQMNAANKEVVGAKLLSKGLTINLGGSESADSRATISGWEVGKDVAGLGWVVKDDPKAYQTDVKLSEVGNTLYSNHFFQYTEDGWNTKSNIYEGWHFAYFSYAHQSRPSELVFNVNDKVYAGGDNREDAYNNAPYLSGAIFLSEDNVDTANGTIEETLNIKRIVNAVYPTLDVTEDFTENDTLNNIAIKSLTVKMSDRNKFYKTIKVVPSNLPTGEIESVDSLYYKKDSVALVREGRTNTITTTLKEGMFKLNQNHETRFFLAPLYKVSSAKDKLSVRVDVAGGHFDVAYTPEKDDKGNDVELTETQFANNAAIEKLNALFNSPGFVSGKKNYSLYNVYETTRFGNMNFVLGLENFTADYLVEDIDDWNACVALADALKEEAPVFTLKKGANVIFTDTITAPKNGVKVTVAEGTGNLTVDGELNWNNAISFDNTKSVHVTVNKDAVLSVDNVLNPSWLYNNGTIKAGALSTISTESGRLTNSGLVIVEYGAYVYPNSGAVGKIAYVVPATNYFDKVATLVKKDNAEGQANVNTLIINEGVTLDCVKTTQTEGTGAVTDRYNPEDEKPGSSSSTALKLDGINIEINGGSIVTTKEYPVTVANVAMNGGSIENVKIASDLMAEGINEIITESIEGKVTISSGETTITGATFKKDVTVEGGKLTLVDCTIEGTLTNKGTVVLESEEYIHITNIVNNGTLIANNDVFVTNVTLNPKSVTTLTDKDLNEMDWNKTIFYTDTYINDKMTLNGTVMKYSIPSFNPAATAEEKGTTATAALENAAKDAVVYLPEGTYNFTKNDQISLAGASLICEPGTVINSVIDDTHLSQPTHKVLYYTLDDVKQVVLKNFTLNVGKTKADIWFRNDNMKENGVVEIIIENVTCNHILFDFLYQNGTTANIKFINCNIGRVDVHANNATSTMNVEYDSASTVNIIPGGTHTENVTVTKK